MLNDTFARVSSGTQVDSEVLVISGYSGTGKSRLVDTFRSEHKERALFACGKCDRALSNEPFAAIQDTFQQLLLEIGESDYQSERIIGDIRAALGKEAGGLTAVIPGLADVIGDTSEPAAVVDTSSAQVRLMHLFRGFARALTKRKPLVLVCDDLQWADSSSMQVLRWLASDPNLRRFLLIGTYRDNEVTPDHPTMVALQGLEKEKVFGFGQLHLFNLLEDELVDFLSGILKRKPSETEAFAEVVFEKCRGNFFFVLQYLQLLQRKKLLCFSFAQISWEWADLQLIRSDTSVANNVVDLIADKMRDLDEDLQLCLKVASCMSSKVRVSILRQIMKRMGLSTDARLVNVLEKGADEGYLIKSGESRYKFAHERIQQAAYALIPKGPERDLMHFRIGSVLLAMQNDSRFKGSEWIRYQAAMQLSLGQSNISSDEGRIELAQLNLSAGKKAISMAAFSTAVDCLKKGMNELDRIEGSWEKHHDLQVSLHQCLADVLCSTGSPVRSEELAHEIVKHAQSNNERETACLTLARALGAQGKFAEAIEMEVSELKRLKVFPKRIIKSFALIQLGNTKKLLKRVTEDDILKLPECQEHDAILAMKLLLSVVRHASYTGDNVIRSLAAATSVKFALKHGIHRATIPSFAQVGVIVAVMFGDAQEGYRLGRMSTSIAKRLNIDDTYTKSLVSGSLNAWHIPLTETLQPLLDTYNSGMKKGDIEMAFSSFVFYLIHSFMSGASLGPLLDEAKTQSTVFKDYGMDATLAILLPARQAMMNLAGMSEDPCSFDGDAMQEEPFLTSTTRNLMARRNLYVWKTLVCYYFGSYELADRMRKKANDSKSTSFAFSVLTIMMYMDALVPLALARKTGSRKYKREARAAIDVMNKAVTKEHKGINLANKLLILDAHYLMLSQSATLEEVQVAFESAIKMSSRSGARSDAALAKQRLGEYYIGRGDDDKATYYLSESVNVWSDWGAEGISDDLKRKYGQIIGSAAMHRSSLAPTVRSTDYLGSNLDDLWRPPEPPALNAAVTLGMNDDAMTLGMDAITLMGDESTVMGGATVMRYERSRSIGTTFTKELDLVQEV